MAYSKKTLGWAGKTAEAEYDIVGTLGECGFTFLISKVDSGHKVDIKLPIKKIIMKQLLLLLFSLSLFASCKKVSDIINEMQADDCKVVGVNVNSQQHVFSMSKTFDSEGRLTKFKWYVPSTFGLDAEAEYDVTYLTDKKMQFKGVNRLISWSEEGGAGEPVEIERTILINFVDSIGGNPLNVVRGEDGVIEAELIYENGKLKAFHHQTTSGQTVTIATVTTDTHGNITSFRAYNREGHFYEYNNKGVKKNHFYEPVHTRLPDYINLLEALGYGAFEVKTERTSMGLSWGIIDEGGEEHNVWSVPITGHKYDQKGNLVSYTSEGISQLIDWECKNKK